jgi:hypothetical protein
MLMLSLGLFLFTIISSWGINCALVLPRILFRSWVKYRRVRRATRYSLEAVLISKTTSCTRSSSTTEKKITSSNFSTSRTQLDLKAYTGFPQTPPSTPINTSQLRKTPNYQKQIQLFSWSSKTEPGTKVTLRRDCHTVKGRNLVHKVIITLAVLNAE